MSRLTTCFIYGTVGHGKRCMQCGGCQGYTLMNKKYDTYKDFEHSQYCNRLIIKLNKTFGYKIKKINYDLEEKKLEIFFK